MPIQKFTSAEEMNAAPVLISTGDSFDRFIRHCARYRKIAPRNYPRGVFKFQSLEEAQAARQHMGNTVRPEIRDQGSGALAAIQSRIIKA